MLQKDLSYIGVEDQFEVLPNKLRDDVTQIKRGVSFIDNAYNRLQEIRKWTLKRILSDKNSSKMRIKRLQAIPYVQRYLRKIDRFRELLLFYIHLTRGQPARGIEITTLRFKNSYLQDYNVFVIYRQIVFVTRYYKSQLQIDKPKVIPCFLLQRVGQVLVVYLIYV